MWQEVFNCHYMQPTQFRKELFLRSTCRRLFYYGGFLKKYLCNGFIIQHGLSLRCSFPTWKCSSLTLIRVPLLTRFVCIAFFSMMIFPCVHLVLSLSENEICNEESWWEFIGYFTAQNVRQLSQIQFRCNLIRATTLLWQTRPEWRLFHPGITWIYIVVVFKFSFNSSWFF